MNKAYTHIGDARKRIDGIMSIARWLWCVNMIVMIIAIMHNKYDLAALCAFTWMASFAAAVTCRRVDKNLVTAERTLISGHIDERINKKAA